MRKIALALMMIGSLLVTETTLAAFGGGKSAGVSRSYSSPRTAPAPSYSASKASSYSAPKASSYSVPKQTYSAPPSRSNYNNRSSSYDNSYNQRNYGGNYQQPSTMRQIGTTAAGVAGGILAAEAISSLIRSPGHPGMYTHPQYPGQYFNAQGVPQPAPQALAPQQDSNYNSGYVQQPQVVYASQPQSKGVMSSLWSGLGSILNFLIFMGVLGALAYGGFKLYHILRRKAKEEIASMKEPEVDLRAEERSLDNAAMDLFYGFQKNSNNVSWLEKHSLYLDVAGMLQEPVKVVTYQHAVIDVAVESGKIRGTVKYHANMADGNNVDGHFWNFQKDGSEWKLIGVEA